MVLPCMFDFCICTAEISNDNGLASYIAVTIGLISGIVLLIVLIALMLAVIVYFNKLQKKQTYSINPEIFNDSHSKFIYIASYICSSLPVFYINHGYNIAG